MAPKFSRSHSLTIEFQQITKCFHIIPYFIIFEFLRIIENFFLCKIGPLNVAQPYPPKIMILINLKLPQKLQIFLLIEFWEQDFSWYIPDRLKVTSFRYFVQILIHVSNIKFVKNLTEKEQTGKKSTYNEQLTNKENLR